MGKSKDVKTNAMRMLDKHKIKYEVRYYECNDFIDGMHIADQLGEEYSHAYKTLVMMGKSKSYYVFVLPVDKEVDLKKAARTVKEKSLEMVHVKDINSVTGYIRGGCTPIGMKKLYPTVIHESAKVLDEIIVSGGKLGIQLVLKPEDLVMVSNAIYADIIQ